MKTILLLGGSAQQVVAITKSKELGYRTVLCDYLPDNPGKDVADVFYLVSTTDKEAILDVAQKERVDGVVAYASDPAAPTAAYVAEKMGLAGQPYKSVEILTNKDLFRSFLSQHGFCTPKAKGYVDFESFVIGLSQFKLPVLLKPVDSSGSKGVCLISNEKELVDKGFLLEKFNEAISFSKVKKVIVEEFVVKKGYQIAGDGFSVDGKLVFRCFGNDHFDSTNSNPFVPVSASFPCVLSDELQQRIHDEIQRLLTLLEMKTGAYNCDIMVDNDDNVYLMEIGPRNGGNYIPVLVQYQTGFDIIEATLRAAMNEPIFIATNDYQKYSCYYALHSKKHGKLTSLSFNKAIEKFITDKYLNFKIGDLVPKFSGASSTLGIILFEFPSLNLMIDTIEQMNYGDGLVLEVSDE